MAKIDDFGEKIGGARKDLYALNRELRLEDIADWSEYDREKYITKKEAFPLPDYKKLYEQGINREVLFYIKEIRDALPTKPSVYIPHKSSPEEKQQLMHKAQEDYINTIGKFYEHAMDLKTISDCMNFYEKIKAENIPAINWLTNRKLRNVVRLDSYGYHSLLTRMRKKQFLYSDEEKILSNYTIFQYDGSNVEKEIDDRQRERLVIKQGGSRYCVYHSNQDPSMWNPNTYFALDSRTHQIKMANMEDVEQLKKTIVDMEETITKEKNITRKKKLVPTQLSHIRPTAEDYRGGKNITGEDMLNTFQFHGGEFGNWESDLDRQTNLNMSFDALNDLAKALEIECADVSLGGDLSIAYGARGITNAAAHFEPGMNVINLTKMKGAGSLAHEWGHALDHYIAMQNGDGIGFATEKPKGKMKELMNVIKYNESGQTEYYQNAKLLDISYGKSGHKGYWQSDVELFARAFASYVRDKLNPDASDYLAGHSEMSGLVEKDGKLVSTPISPQGEERKRINETMEALIEDLKEQKILHHAKRIKEVEPAQEELRDTTEADVKQGNSFSEQVDLALLGKVNPYDALKVCETPEIFCKVGCSQLPMLYTQKHLKDALHPKSNSNSSWHGLTIQQIKSIPEALESPAIIFDSISEKNPNAIVAILDVFDNDNAPIMVVITPNGEGMYELVQIESNFIDSIYGKDNGFYKYMEKVAKSGNVLYCNKQKSQKLFMFQGLQLPKAFNNLDFNKIIKQSSNVVNTNHKEVFAKQNILQQDSQYQDFAKLHQEFIANKEVSRIPVVINAFGGPGSGKSVSCMDICQQLKKLGYNAEYVQEYAKDLVYDENWDMLNGSPENQFKVLKEQLRRIDRLYGSVDFIVTDSPVLLNSVYNKTLTPQYDNMVTSLYKDFENFTYFVERDTSSYQQEGRIQNLEESQKIDEEIKQLLAEKDVYYGTYNHDTINKIVSNSIKTFNRINHVDEEATAKQVAYAEKIATTLNIDLPEEKTKEAYRFFISEYQKTFANSNAKLSDITLLENLVDEETRKQIDDELEQEVHEWKSLTRSAFASDKGISHMLKVCRSSVIMQICGAEKYDVYIPQATMLNIIASEAQPHGNHSQGHELYEEDVYSIPYQLNNPSYVILNSKKDSLVFVTDRNDDKDRRIIISVALDRKNGRMNVNQVTSMYGRKNFENYLNTNIQEGNLIAYNTKKANELRWSQRVQFPRENVIISFDNNIPYLKEEVKNQIIAGTYTTGLKGALKEVASTAESIYQSHLERVSQNGNLLKDVPEEYHTEELLLAAVSNWGAAIRNVSADKLTSTIVLASVTQYGTNLRHVPKEMRSEEVCIAAYVNSAGKAIRYTPSEIRDAVKAKAQQILSNNNTSIPSSKRQLEVEQLQEQGQEWATQISNMLREHESDPEAMVEDIIFASKFYQYSVKNIQIMRQQNPGMTFVASASAFDQMGYHVKNGEAAMIARVPSFSKYVIGENGEYIYASKYTPEIKNKIKQGVLEEHEKLTRYVFRQAFYDISQTDCPIENYPSMFHMGVPSELHQEAFHAMKEFAQDCLGFKVMTVDLKSISLRGNCEPDNKIIRVNDKLESTLALSTLCHEIAHGIIHTSKESAKMTTAQKECEADVMAIMLESSMGLAISESRREHFYQAFNTYKEEQASKERPYEVTLEKLIDRVQKKVFRPYADDIKYYLALHLPVDGVQNDNVARNLVKDMALFDSAYQLHFNLSIEPEHEVFAEDKIELYRTLYQKTKEEYRLGNSFVPKLAVIKDFGKEETFLTSVQFIDKETVDTIKNLSAHVTQEYLPLQIEMGDVLAIKENVLEDSQLYVVTEQGLKPLSDKLNQEIENKINCGFDVSTEYQCIRNLLQNNIEILSDTIPEYYNHICERFGYTKDVAQMTSNQFMARINLITEGMSSNDKELIAEYVFRTGNYQKAEKYAEKLQKEPCISKQLLQEMRLIDSYKYMLWTIADYEDAHSVSGEKRITTGAYNNASIPLLSENAHSLSQINEYFLEIKKHNASESIKYYSIVQEEEGYRIGYVELDDYVPSIKYSTGVYSSYEEAKEFYNLYLETANSHLVAATQANHLVDLEKEANLIALTDVTAIGNTIADEKYRYKEAGMTERDLLNLLRDKIDNYPDVNSTHTLDAQVQILKDFKQTINDFGEKHFVELCNLDDFSDINTMEESLQVANWLSKQREVVANSGQNGIEAVTQLIDMAMENCVTTADLEQAYNAIDSIVLNSEYSNLKAHFDGFEDYNSAFDTLKSSFVTADKFCYIDYKADDIPMLYTSDPAGNVYKKSLRNEWTGSVQEMYGKLQKAGYEVCSNFDDFKAYAMNNRLAGPGAPERKKEGAYVRVIESTSDLLTKGQTLSVYDFKHHMDKIYSGSSDVENSVTYKLITRGNHEIQSYIDTYSGDENMNVYEKLYDKAKEQAPELCKMIGKQYYQDVIDFSERHLMKPLLEQLKEQGKTEVDSEELQNLTSSCDKLKDVIKELDLSPAEAEILKLNVGSMQVGQVADIQRQMQLQQNQQLQKQRNKQNEGISLV